MRQTVGILGTPVDVLDTNAVLDRLEQFICERRFHQVATANTDFLVNALEDPELRHILRHADLVMPDGMPLIWASRLMRTPLPERVTGADIVPALAERSARKGYRIFMLGARPEVAQRAKECMEALYSGIKIVGCYSPPVAPLLDMNHRDILDRIHLARPDILLVAFGNPKQEKWIHLNREELSEVPVCIGVGGTFDFIAGNTSRAPLWMQRSGLEWVHRLVQEPRRLWKRYVRDMAHFTRCLVWQRMALGNPAKMQPAVTRTAQIGDCTILSVIGNLNGCALPEFQKSADQALEARTHLILDFQNVTGLDGLAIGTLINLPKRAAQHGLDMRLVAVSPAVARVLKGSQLNDGPYLGSPSLAQAFLSTHYSGLCWNVQLGSEAALIEISGSSENHSVMRLERLCEHLLETGKRIDLDMREVKYADSVLLMMLQRLAAKKEPGIQQEHLRITPGSALRSVLEREKAVGRFTLIDVPQAPLDAVVQTLDAREGRSIEPFLEPDAVLKSINNQ